VPTNAGTYAITADFTPDDTANYNSLIGASAGNFVIQKAGTPVLLVTNSPAAYTGTPQAATVVGSVAGTVSNVLYNGSATVPANAGSYAITADFTPDDTANYDSVTGVAAGALVIQKAAATTTVTCSAGPFTYTGAAISPCTASVTGTGGLSQVLAVTYAGNVNAGTATAGASYAGSANYLPSSDSETFTIGKAATTTTVTCSAGPFTYTGAAIKPCTATVTGSGLNQALAVTYADNTNAGTATGSASYAESANHLASSESETFTIGKAATTTTVTCSAGPFTFTGTPIEPCTASVTGPGGLNQALAVTYAGNTNAGTATAGASYAGSANHLASSDSETFVIGEAATTVDLHLPYLSK
jgi:hypothetical protein